MPEQGLSLGTILFLLVLVALAGIGKLSNYGAEMHHVRVADEAAARVGKGSAAAAFGVEQYRICLGPGRDDAYCRQVVAVLAARRDEQGFAAAAQKGISDYQAAVAAEPWPLGQPSSPAVKYR